nr:immunoglobulin heavy chain junction region [Mus musculus]
TVQDRVLFITTVVATTGTSMS